MNRRKSPYTNFPWLSCPHCVSSLPLSPCSVPSQAVEARGQLGNISEGPGAYCQHFMSQHEVRFPMMKLIFMADTFTLFGRVELLKSFKLKFICLISHPTTTTTNTHTKGTHMPLSAVKQRYGRVFKIRERKQS